MARYGDYGKIDFSGLWSVMEKKKLNKQWLRNHGIHANTVAKLVKNENVTCDVIATLCYLLDVQPNRIMKFVPPETEPATIPGGTGGDPTIKEGANDD